MYRKTRMTALQIKTGHWDGIRVDLRSSTLISDHINFINNKTINPQTPTAFPSDFFSDL